MSGSQLEAEEDVDQDKLVNMPTDEALEAEVMLVVDAIK